MRFVLYVKGERGHRTLDELLKRDFRPEACITEAEDSVVSGLCTSREIPLIVEKRPRRADHIDAVHQFRPDLLVCAGYSRILPSALFDTLPRGAINCHGGKLPEYRGASPIPWQIINGETRGAAYVLRMTAGIDDGPILAEASYDILESDTARDLTDKVTSLFGRMIPDVVEAFALGTPPEERAQSEVGACHWTRRYPQDGQIVWGAMSVREVINLVRALDDPYPGAFIERGDETVRVRRAAAFPRKMAGVPGRVVGRTEEGCLILARDGAVELLELEIRGSRITGNEFPARYGETF